MCWTKMGILYAAHHSSYPVSLENVTDVLVSDDIVHFQPPKNIHLMKIHTCLGFTFSVACLLYDEWEFNMLLQKSDFLQYVHLET